MWDRQLCITLQALLSHDGCSQCPNLDGLSGHQAAANQQADMPLLLALCKPETCYIICHCYACFTELLAEPVFEGHIHHKAHLHDFNLADAVSWQTLSCHKANAFQGMEWWC